MLRRLVVGGLAAVRATGTALLGAGAEGFVDDGLDGARAAAAFGAAAEAAVDLLGVPGKLFRAIDRVADIVVGQDVTGTNDHGSGRPFGDAPSSISNGPAGCKRKNRSFKQFQTAPASV